MTAHPTPPDHYEAGVQCHREELTPEQRALSLDHTIDPGFVNRRLIETIVGERGRGVIDELIRQLPDLPNWMRETRIGHIYKDVALTFCRVNGIRTLGEVIHDRKGRMFCSTEPLGPCPEIYDGASERLISRWTPYAASDVSVELHYSRQHVTSDTLRSELHEGDELSIVAHLDRRKGETLVFYPLVMGSPWLHTEDPKWADEVMWWGRNFYEHFLEDFAEFSKVGNVPKPSSPEPMRLVSERAFKRALATILGDSIAADWGGETADYVTAHLHLDGRRVTGAFLLKGPAHFVPMTLNHLGKNNDQIYRLAQEPADVLFVQHCHDVTSAVRATLRAFAVQPSRARRYCIVDGRDSLWLLQAFGLYDQAVEWSRRNG